ncbi:hypothetical protein M0811_01531 [Anaeramoeba ignava]|uniref:F-box domain-containing protein n=1 Tax=Anaeramoeba ignava TaxID=1746090 RepID=A0A9Q0LFV7_ANAIG|nr:hypothetical protein M0811_01531 [Anaeramoeba ignava]
MEQFTIQKYGDKLKAKITNGDFNFLKIGEMSEVPTKLKKPPKQENLFIEMLPEDVHLYIFQFLSPGSLLKLSMTCQTFNDLSQDINCWRNMSFKYWRYFLLNNFEMQNYYRYYGNSKEDQIPIHGIIEEPKIINSNLQLKSFIDKKPQKLIQRQSSISLMFNQLQNLREKKEEDQNYIFPEKDYRSYMMRYIQSTPNPKNELISKSKLINQKIKERKEKYEEFLKNQAKINKQNLLIRKLDGFMAADFKLFAFLIIVFLVSLSIYVDKNLNSNPFYFFIPLLVSIFIFSSLNFIKSFFDFSYSKASDLMFSLISFVVFIQVLLIGLKSGKIIQISWLWIFTLFFILTGILVLGSILIFIGGPNLFTFLLVFSSSILFLFFILLGLKLNGKSGLGYFKVFSPLFLIDILSALVCISSLKASSHSRGGLEIIFVIFFVFILIPLIIFEILIFCYLQFSGFKYISFTFIPLYFPLFGLFYLVFSLKTF